MFQNVTAFQDTLYWSTITLSSETQAEGVGGHSLRNALCVWIYIYIVVYFSALSEQQPDSTVTGQIVHLLQAVLLQADDVQIKFFPKAVRLVYNYLSSQTVPLGLWRGDSTKEEQWKSTRPLKT